MHAFVPIDELRDVEIRRDAGKLIGIVARQVLLVHEIIDHLAQRHFGGFVQVFMNPHRDVMGRRFRARPAQLHVLANDQLKRPDQ